MPNLRASLVITFFSSNGATACYFVITLVLARLLTPSEIGVFSMAAVLVGIAHVFRDFGVSSYILQTRELTPQMLRAAMGVLYAASWLLAGLLFAASAAIAGFFGQPQVQPVLQVLALGFMVIPVGSIPNSLLTRDLRAREQAVVVGAGVITYGTVVLTLAYLGFGPMSLAWANLANIVVCAAGYSSFRVRGTPWLPSLRGWRRVASFGGGAILSGCVERINLALPDVVLGKLSSAHDVGIMSRATATANIFMQVAGPAANYAALPMLSRLHHAGQPVRAAIAKAAAYLTVCGWPPLVVIALFPGEVITLLYGAAWMECVPVISWLCLAAGIAMTFNFHGAGLLAIGRPYLSVLPPAALLAFRLAVVFMVYDGTLISFAQALAAAAAASVPVGLWIQLRLFGMPVREFAREIVPSVLVTLACLAAALALHAALPGTWPVALRLAVVLLAETAVWLFALIWVRHPLVAELELLGRRMAPAGRLLTGARALVGR